LAALWTRLLELKDAERLREANAALP